MQETAGSSSSILGDLVDSVLDAVTKQSAAIKHGDTEGENDVLTRLALVRMAMANFLSLWNEYAASMDRKFKRFHSSDTEFVAGMETNLKSQLARSETAVQTENAKISDLKKELEIQANDEVEFENYFTSKMNDLKADLQAMNDDRNVKTLHANHLLNEFENFEHENYASTKESIKKLIDQFDGKVVGRVGQANVFTSSSLLQKEIGDLDRRVEKII
jgi:hypothetical protein